MADDKTAVTLPINEAAIREVAAENDWSVMSYSGRGMFGRQCIAVTLPLHNCVGRFFFGLGALNETLVNAHVTHELFDYKTDNMGDNVVVYWPQIPFTGAENAE